RDLLAVELTALMGSLPWVREAGEVPGVDGDVKESACRRRHDGRCRLSNAVLAGNNELLADGSGPLVLAIKIKPRRCSGRDLKMALIGGEGYDFVGDGRDVVVAIVLLSATMSCGLTGSGASSLSSAFWTASIIQWGNEDDNGCRCHGGEDVVDARWGLSDLEDVVVSVDLRGFDLPIGLRHEAGQRQPWLSALMTRVEHHTRCSAGVPRT
ncbi:hypothetical protein ACLOJK_024006, partial [Asimina triloba]